MSDNSEALRILASETKKLINNSLKSAPYDVTKKGIIKDVLESNMYLVEINGTEYTVQSTVSVELKKNDAVLVLFSKNNSNDKYITAKCGESKTVTDIFVVSATAPDNTKLLWIDTNSNTGGLKYYNGSIWVTVPVSYS